MNVCLYQNYRHMCPQLQCSLRMMVKTVCDTSVLTILQAPLQYWIVYYTNSTGTNTACTENEYELQYNWEYYDDIQYRYVL